MLLPPDRLAAIAAQASFPWERLAAGLCRDSRPCLPDIDAKLRQWRDVACGGDEARFCERLARDGLDLDHARRLLAQPTVPADFTLPEWCRILNLVLEVMPRLRDAATAADVATRFGYLRSNDPIAFEELLLPFVEAARELLGAEETGCPAPEVSDAFSRNLLQRLSEIVARVLAVEFRAFLAWTGSGADNEPGPERNTQYRRFVAKVYRDGWAPLIEEYCVMSRLLAVAVMQWVGQAAEFLRRLDRDADAIAQTFNRGVPSGGVVAVELGLSDPHDGGRSVILVRFSGGLRLVYKPRGLGVEKAWFDLAEWINGCGAFLPLRLLRVLDRVDYGWVEYAENRQCAASDEVQRYYRRAGNLLALVYALNGTDFHFENLVADGEHPVPIDLETVFHHRIVADGNGEVDEMAGRLRVSVLSTDLLPDPVKTDHQYFDVSAFARSETEEGESDVVVWKNVNTDAMDYAWERQRPRAARNLPRFNGGVVPLNDYTSSILHGFEEAFRFLQQNASLLCSEDGPLRPLFRHDGRFIFRSTALYALILRRALHPGYLCDGADFAMQLDWLARRLLEEQDAGAFWPLLRAEADSLGSLDIPRFTVRGDGTTLGVGAGKRIEGCFASSAWDAAKAKIAALSETDLRWQSNLIVGSLDMRIANLGPVAVAAGTTDVVEEVAPLERDEMIDIAVRLAHEIEAKAFRQDNGELGWMVLHYSPAAERYTLQAMENDLYNGRAGVALFFAALGKFRSDLSFGDLAWACLAPIRRWVRSAGDDELLEFGFGGYGGLASVAYALARAGAFLGDDRLVEDAGCVALRIRPEQIRKDDSLDAMSGSAGAIPALLACHGATGDPKVLAMAIACGQHLLGKRATDKFGLRTWPTLEGRHLTGFSHGAAGIAYALLLLFKATGDSEFYDAAFDAILFERLAFVEEQNNWQDLRRAAVSLRDGPVFSMAWCHGAPGIGLSRIAALDMMDTEVVRRDIEAALVSTAGVNLLPRDHLCCGNAGLMDTLCTAGERFPHQDWARKARQLAARTLMRSESRGGFNIAFHNGFFNPSLFQGTAGIGYQLLRLADPARVPSVLLLN